MAFDWFGLSRWFSAPLVFTDFYRDMAPYAYGLALGLGALFAARMVQGALAIRLAFGIVFYLLHSFLSFALPALIGRLDLAALVLTAWLIAALAWRLAVVGVSLPIGIRLGRGDHAVIFLFFAFLVWRFYPLWIAEVQGAGLNWELFRYHGSSILIFAQEGSLFRPYGYYEFLLLNHEAIAGGWAMLTQSLAPLALINFLNFALLAIGFGVAASEMGRHARRPVLAKAAMGAILVICLDVLCAYFVVPSKNDVTASLPLVTGLILTAVALSRPDPASRPHWPLFFLIACLLGLSAGTKPNAFALAALAGGALTLLLAREAWRTRRAAPLAVALACATAVFLPASFWFARNAVLLGSPLGNDPHFFNVYFDLQIWKVATPFFGHDSLLPLSQRWTDGARFQVWLFFLGLFGVACLSLLLWADGRLRSLARFQPRFAIWIFIFCAAQWLLDVFVSPGGFGNPGLRAPPGMEGEWMRFGFHGRYYISFALLSSLSLALVMAAFVGRSYEPAQAAVLPLADPDARNKAAAVGLMALFFSLFLISHAQWVETATPRMRTETQARAAQFFDEQDAPLRVLSMGNLDPALFFGRQWQHRIDLIRDASRYDGAPEDFLTRLLCAQAGHPYDVLILGGLRPKNRSIETPFEALRTAAQTHPLLDLIEHNPHYALSLYRPRPCPTP